MLESVLAVFLSALQAGAPILGAAITSLVVTLMRGNVLSRLNPSTIPLLLPAASGILSSIGAAVGVPIDPLTLAAGDASVWEAGVGGVVNGMLAVGFHQALRKVSKVRDEGVVSS